MRTGIYVDLENIAVAIKTSRAKKESDNVPELVANAVRGVLDREVKSTDASDLRKVAFYIGADKISFVDQYLGDLVESGAIYVPVKGKYPDKASMIEMSLDMALDSKTERFVIVGGCADYAHVIKKLVDFDGCKVFLYGVHRSTSHSLVNLVGKNNFRDITKMIFKKEPDPNFDPTEQEVINKFMNLLLDAQQDHPTSNGAIWLNPFLKNYMNEAYNNLNNDQRKQIIEVAESIGLIKVEKNLDKDQGIEFTTIRIIEKEEE